MTFRFASTSLAGSPPIICAPTVSNTVGNLGMASRPLSVNWIVIARRSSGDWWRTISPLSASLSTSRVMPAVSVPRSAASRVGLSIPCVDVDEQAGLLGGQSHRCETLIQDGSQVPGELNDQARRFYRWPRHIRSYCVDSNCPIYYCHDS